MASFVRSAKLSARVVGRHAPQCAARRGFTVSARDEAAQNFSMPALSPTMTEGNISSWRIKEGDSFSAGDVLLEIETDKATMDVEAQDDGILAKITQPDGSKGVKVGQRIAVTAEPGDDISSLKIPKEEAASSAGEPAKKDRPSPQDEVKGDIDATESSPSAAEAPPSSRPEADAPAGGAAEHTGASKSSEGSSGKVQKRNYPLYPSVEHLLHQNGMSATDAEKIPASGPSGRLLKGDVLAYLGRIQKDYPAKASARISKLGHLDLSNIQLAKPAPKPDAPKAAAPSAPESPQETEIALPISLTAVIATQKRVQDSLGIFLPLSTFIARASELANEDLPASRSKPTADDLFNAVLGLDKIAKSSRGNYIPQVTGLAPMPLNAPTRAIKKPDIIDMLAPKIVAKKAVKETPGAVSVATGDNLFSVTARLGEERRAAEYLERLKLALEKEPGRLVL
ncbi:e3 binding domain [Teratosphaeria destructans]|uniref:E3 binding domain n=1 Tax=Teratosphaeria destructans TaxID=418781 RepID=A0A9W7SQY4_9PEZI|nr:e3 binding domain [Teratosphaeria destructans]